MAEKLKAVATVEMGDPLLEHILEDFTLTAKAGESSLPTGHAQEMVAILVTLVVNRPS